jgi:hypothetical protein
VNTTEERFVVWLATLCGGFVLLAMPIFLGLDGLVAVMEAVAGICVIGYAARKLYGVIRLPSPRELRKKRFG